MQDNNCNTIFVVDGYEVSATFASHHDPTVAQQVKQILLSSFAAQTATPAN